MILAGRVLRRHAPRLQPWIERPGRALPLAAHAQAAGAAAVAAFPCTICPFWTAPGGDGWLNRALVPLGGRPDLAVSVGQ